MLSCWPILWLVMCANAYNYDEYNGCDARTVVFREYGNAHDQYFIHETFMAYSLLPAKTHGEFMRRIAGFTGGACLNVTLDQTYYGWTVGHVIPLGNTIPQLAGCCAGGACDILGNMVVMNNHWRLALGDGFYGERYAVFGTYIVDSAYRAVSEACHGRRTKVDAPMCQPSEAMQFLGAIVVMLGIVLISTGIVVLIFAIVCTLWHAPKKVA